MTFHVIRFSLEPSLQPEAGESAGTTLRSEPADIVADDLRREKVMREITRPVFSLLEHGALRDKCTYISYEKLREIGALPHLEDVKESILCKYEEKAEDDSSHS